MRTVKQLLRQPLKTIFGVLMMTLGTAALCVGLGQAHASNTTSATLENSFDTVAVMSAEAIINHDIIYSAPVLNFEKGEEAAQWVTQTAAEHPEIVKMVSQNGLASAYVRDLTPISYYTNGYGIATGWGGLSGVMGSVKRIPQSCAMFEITLREIGTPQPNGFSYVVDNVLPQSAFQDYFEWMEYQETLEVQSVLSGYFAELSGEITQVLSLEESFKDPTGMTLKFSFNATSLEELNSVLEELEPGKRYLVYGINYYDTDWELRKNMEVDEWDFSKLRLATQREKELWAENGGLSNIYAIYDGEWMFESTYNTINTVSLNVRLSAYSTISYEPVRDESGTLVEIREITEAAITDLSGSSVVVTPEEFGEYYKIPSIIPLEGTAQEFLASKDGSLWRAALERDFVNNHAFPVIGVDDLGYVAQFALGEARIVEGRAFAEQELTDGTAVCVISQELAEANGLQVGDIIHPNFYSVDENLPYQETLAKDNSVINPSAGLYFTTTPLLGEMEYTIVGIYRSDEPWANVTNEENHYAFTPNTIFVPKASVPAKMQYSSLLQFQTVVLHNGQMENFAAMVNKAGYGGFYRLDDQGYGLIAKNFSDYQALSRKVLLVCTAAYAMIALLYLLLFPCSQRKTMQLMESLGASSGQRRRHVFGGSLALLLPASVLGTVAGFLLWDGIIAKMKLSVDVLVEMELDVRWLLAVSLAQLILMAALSALMAVFQARPHKLSARR